MPSDRTAVGNYLTIGSVDGSNARPGTVGEFLTTGSQWVDYYAGGSPPHDMPMVGNAHNSTRVCTLNLPPGDWDVSAGIDMGLYGAVTIPSADQYWQVYLGPLRPNWADSDSDVDVAWFLMHTLAAIGQHEFSMGVIRISSATPTTVIMNVQIDAYENVAAWAGGIIRARRTR